MPFTPCLGTPLASQHPLPMSLGILLVLVGCCGFYLAATTPSKEDPDREWVYDPLMWTKVLRRLPLKVARGLLIAIGLFWIAAGAAVIYGALS